MGIRLVTATLNKSPYSLRQLSRVFDELLLSKLMGYGLKGFAKDPFIFRFASRVESNIKVVVEA